MSRSTISTFKLFELFPDEPSARKYLESRLWPNGVVCSECKSKERITVRKDGFYRCNACKLDFTVRTKTIFERSHVPLHRDMTSGGIDRMVCVLCAASRCTTRTLLAALTTIIRTGVSEGWYTRCNQIIAGFENMIDEIGIDQALRYLRS